MCCKIRGHQNLKTFAFFLKLNKAYFSPKTKDKGCTWNLEGKIINYPPTSIYCIQHGYIPIPHEGRHQHPILSSTFPVQLQPKLSKILPRGLGTRHNTKHLSNSMPFPPPTLTSPLSSFFSTRTNSNTTKKKEICKYFSLSVSSSCLVFVGPCRTKRERSCHYKKRRGTTIRPLKCSIARSLSSHSLFSL